MCPRGDGDDLLAVQGRHYADRVRPILDRMARDGVPDPERVAFHCVLLCALAFQPDESWRTLRSRLAASPADPTAPATLDSLAVQATDPYLMDVGRLWIWIEAVSVGLVPPGHVAEVLWHAVRAASVERQLARLVG